MTKSPSGIYKITNLANNQVYIGQSENMFLRRKQHFVALRHGSHPNAQMQKDYTTQRGHYFRWDVVEYCEINNLNEREKYWIDKYNSINCGYNQGWQPYKRKTKKTSAKVKKYGYRKK